MVKFDFAPKAFEHIFHKRLIFNLFHIFYFIFDVCFVNIPRSYPALHVLRKTTLWHIIAVLRQELHLSAMRSDTVAYFFLGCMGFGSTIQRPVRLRTNGTPDCRE
jgi:hypothetical protein